MASNHASLDAAATERKARLAKLKSLKRKQPDNDEQENGEAAALHAGPPSPPKITDKYLSGRNYDPETRGPKLGFESAPDEDQETLEDRAAQIAEETRQRAEKEEKDEKPIDLFKLQPKKPNWDLKRDLASKVERLNVQTENAIARLVRQRIEAQKKKDGGDDVGMKGEELLEGVHVREREEAEKERREREDDDMV